MDADVLPEQLLLPDKFAPIQLHSSFLTRTTEHNALVPAADLPLSLDETHLFSLSTTWRPEQPASLGITDTSFFWIRAIFSCNTTELPLACRRSKSGIIGIFFHSSSLLH